MHNSYVRMCCIELKQLNTLPKHAANIESYVHTYVAEETHLKVATFAGLIFSIHVIGTRKH